jgi:probable addiction module antidote protein
MTTRLVAAKNFRNDAKAIAEHLNEAMSTKDPLLIMRAIRAMVHAQGLTRFSRKAALTRGTVDKIFTAEESPAFDTVLKLLFALDVRLVAEAVAEAEEAPDLPAVSEFRQESSSIP